MITLGADGEGQAGGQARSALRTSEAKAITLSRYRRKRCIHLLDLADDRQYSRGCTPEDRCGLLPCRRSTYICRFRYSHFKLPCESARRWSDLVSSQPSPEQ